ncbi:MAG: hypothetical protein FJ387_07995, partial [Verrucomicrobia bacterium]|nr:hypothetical protein [Verrucomicrobiota bacterium]
MWHTAFGGASTSNHSTLSPAQARPWGKRGVQIAAAAVGLGVLAALTSLGTVNFNNRVIADGIDAPVYDEDGVTRLSGAAYLAQLYAGPPGAALAAVGTPVPFRTGTAAGYVSSGVDSSVNIPTVLAGDWATVEMRVWESAAGPTYETAVASGGKHGVSNRLQLRTGGAGAPPTLPANLIGLQFFSLRRGGPPTIVRQPVDQVVALGGTARFSVEAAGTAPLSYQWRKGGVNLSGATDATLTLVGVQPSDEGAYTVEVRNSLGSAVSQGAALVVLVPPVITEAPVGGTVVAGGTASFRVTAIGSAPLSYQWRFNGANLAGETGPTLTLGNVQVGQAGAYTVEVRNGAGVVVSGAAVLTVHYALMVVADGGTVSVEPGGSSYPPGTVVRLTARADAGYAFALWQGAVSGTGNPATLTMNANHTVEALFAAIAGTVNFANRVLVDGIDAPVLDEDGVTRLAGEGYRAQLYGGASAEAMGALGRPVSFRSEAAAGYIAATVVVVPDVVPGGMAFVQMRAWDAAAGDTYEEALAADGKHGTSGVLSVRTGGAGSPPSLPGNLLGLESFALRRGTPPAIVEPPSDLIVIAGGIARFAVVADGTAPLRFQWYWNGALITGATDAILELVGVAPADAGAYHVRVQNDVGEVSSDPVALVVLVPPRITVEPEGRTIFAGETVGLTVTATGSVPLAYQWYEGVVGDTAKPVGDGSPSFTSPALLTSTQYWVRVTNPAGQIDSAEALINVVRRPQTIGFPPLANRTYGDPPVALGAAASSGLPVGFAIVSGPGSLAGPNLTLLGAGTIVVQAGQPGNAYFEPAPPVQRTLVVAKAPAQIALANLSHTYNGTAKAATATTTPAGLTVAFTYNGSATAPVNAGTYTVQATINDANYQGTTSGTLTIAKATAQIALANLAHTYNGTAKAATATTTPAGLTVAFTYNGSASAPVNAGTYTVQATVNDANYEGTTSGALTIAKATAQIALANLAHTYNGTAKAATAT